MLKIIVENDLEIMTLLNNLVLTCRFKDNNLVFFFTLYDS